MSQNGPHQEREFYSFNGYVVALFGVLLLGILGWMGYNITQQQYGTPNLFQILVGVALLVVAWFCFSGLYILQPNSSYVLTLFGQYAGTDRSEGPRWALPFYRRRPLSLRARNLNTPTLKVNDRRGNPIEIGAAIVWRVQDTAQAVFEVDSFENYVSVQAEAALRHLASLYNYDEGDDGDQAAVTLRGNIDDVAHALQRELQARFAPAGVEAVDAKLTHLAYAPEIAQVMLRRQQAEAIISARQKIVQGAVSMVEEALHSLSGRGIVDLDIERKAALVSNLLVVLCSDRETQPIINTGSHTTGH